MFADMASAGAATTPVTASQHNLDQARSFKKGKPQQLNLQMGKVPHHGGNEIDPECIGLCDPSDGHLGQLAAAGQKCNEKVSNTVMSGNVPTLVQLLLQSQDTPSNWCMD